MPVNTKSKSKQRFSLAEIAEKGYSKSEYARKIGCSPTWINTMIEQGDLMEIKFNGGSFVYPLNNS
jgi:hypothetical protein